MKQRTDLTAGPIMSSLLYFALPTLGSSILQSANGSIDAVWVGNLLGENALAATTNGNLVMFMLTAFVFGFGMAAMILIGQAVGRGAMHDAKEVVGTAIGTFAPLAVVIAVAGWFVAPHILALLGTGPEITPLARAFLRVTFLAMPAILMQTMLMMALRGSGDSLTPLIFMALAVVLDIVLNPLFILGRGPFPEMGIGGSAFAMAVANYVSLLAMLAYLYLRRHPLRLVGSELAMLRPAPHILRLMLAKGLPIGLQMVVVSSAMLTMMTLVNREGVDTTAAFGATQQIWTYVQMPAMALGAAVSAMAAQNIGAGRWDRVSQVTRAGIILNFLLTGGLVLALVFADRFALELFLGAGSPAIAIGEHIAGIATWGFVAFGITMVLFGTIRANGQVIWPLIILTISLYPIRLGVALGLGERMGADALWLSFPVAMLATMVMAIALYLHGGWRRRSDLSHLDESDAAELAPQASVTTEAGPPTSPRNPPLPPARETKPAE